MALEKEWRMAKGYVEYTLALVPIVQWRGMQLDPANMMEEEIPFLRERRRRPKINNFDMKIMLWNVRGAGNENFKHNFRELVKCHKPTIAILTETRVSEWRALEVMESLSFNG